MSLLRNELNKSMARALESQNLRAQVVEAMAQAIDAAEAVVVGGYFETFYAEAALDALLDELKERWEWVVDLSPGDEQWTLQMFHSLIAALRAGKGSE